MAGRGYQSPQQQEQERSSAPHLPMRQYSSTTHFILGEGIAQDVITADLHIYLGPDAEVFPGWNARGHGGQPGYWITASRNLPSSMLEDLKMDTLQWGEEIQTHSGGFVDSTPRDYISSRTHAARESMGPSNRQLDTPSDHIPYIRVPYPVEPLGQLSPLQPTQPWYQQDFPATSNQAFNASVQPSGSEQWRDVAHELEMGSRFSDEFQGYNVLSHSGEWATYPQGVDYTLLDEDNEFDVAPGMQQSFDYQLMEDRGIYRQRSLAFSDYTASPDSNLHQEPWSSLNMRAESDSTYHFTGSFLESEDYADASTAYAYGQSRAGYDSQLSFISQREADNDLKRGDDEGKGIAGLSRPDAESPPTPPRRRRDA
ncbi:integral membrane protein [Stemphylium lycopersici]|nr:integral membrane protein [Stemphylium lycopersici]